MSGTRQALLTFFKKIANRDRLQLLLLKQDASFQLEASHWHFKLPDLYRHLSKQDPQIKTLTYLQFRKAMYTCPIHQAIKKSGAGVIISDNQNNVDRSTYSLIWQPGKYGY
jgi:hypothetical protein